MTDQQRQKLLAHYFDLEGYMQEYRKTLLWLTHGNHHAIPPTEQETHTIIQHLREKIIALFTEIESEIQNPQTRSWPNIVRLGVGLWVDVVAGRGWVGEWGVW